MIMQVGLHLEIVYRWIKYNDQKVSKKAETINVHYVQNQLEESQIHVYPYSQFIPRYKNSDEDSQNKSTCVVYELRLRLNGLILLHITRPCL